ILLVIEVADTTVVYDRDVKLPLYARVGIPEAWLVDLERDRVQVCREPAGGRYTSVREVSRGNTITPLRFPTLTVAPDDVLRAPATDIERSRLAYPGVAAQSSAYSLG